MITRKLQQDTLENTFSFIRLKGGWNKNPTTRQFQSDFRFLLIRSFVRKSTSSNCQESAFDDSNLYLKALERFLDKPLKAVDRHTSEHHLRLSGADVQGNVLSRPSTMLFSKTDYNDSDYEPGNDNVSAYMGTFCVKKIVQRTNCPHCKRLLNNKINNIGDNILTFNRAYSPESVHKTFDNISYFDTVCYQTMLVFKLLNNKFWDVSSTILNNNCTNVSSKVESELTKEPLVSEWLSNCQPDCRIHRRKMIKLFIRCKIFRIVKDQNEKWQQPKSWSQTRIELRNQ
jgi:hypothetical protein